MSAGLRPTESLISVVSACTDILPGATAAHYVPDDVPGTDQMGIAAWHECVTQEHICRADQGTQ